MKTGILAGTFDIIHPGYIDLFEFCKQNCDKFIILLHSNPNIERKNKKIPIFSVEERIKILKSIKYIDDVLVYNTDEKLFDFLKSQRFDIRFLGSDYKSCLSKITGYNLVPIIFHERNHPWSYTELCRKIIEREKI